MSPSEKVRTLNPATEQTLREFSYLNSAEIERALSGAHAAYTEWSRRSLVARIACVEKFELALVDARTALAELMTAEMGKTLKESFSEIDKCIASCKTLRTQYPQWREELAYNLNNGYRVSREPMGVLLGIMPWNFPLWQVLRFAIPALLSGNTILLKHAPATWGSAELIGELFARAVPPGCYQNLRIGVDAVARLLADARVVGVSLTGSRAAGKSVGELAGRHLKKAVLELGGSDAYVILDDADVELAAKTCVTSRLLNAGQSCVAGKRFIVTRKNSAAFTEAMRTGLLAKKLGDPTLQTTDIGPLARRDLRDQLHNQVEKSVAAGARLLLGGMVPAQQGFYYPPTLLANVKPGQPAFDGELFGPVAAIIEAKDEAEAIRLANQSIYGLGGGIFSRDIERALKIATSELEAGMVFVNDFVKSDALVPFGGVKDSGLGRELGREGSFEFTYVKTIFAANS